MASFSSEDSNNIFERKKVLAIVGPTGVGKTEKAVLLAKEFNGEIVSCDSVQLYRELNIGSAKPSFEDRNHVTHHLIDVFEPGFQIDVGIYKAKAEEAILDIYKRNKLPVITGGTGLYFNSLYFGLYEAPSRDDSLRTELEKRAENEGLYSLYVELNRIDPVSAKKIMPGDKRRIVRALEVSLKSGIQGLKPERQNKKLNLNWFIIGLACERNKLYERIEKRIDKMIEGGLIEETKSIMEKYGRNAYALGSIGYRHAINFINGTWSKDELVYNLKLDTRHYAKRQLTWFKKIKEVHWFDPEDFLNIRSAVRYFLEDKSVKIS